MPSTKPRDAAAAVIAGIAFVVVAVVVITAGPFNGEYETTSAYVNDAAFLVALLASAVAVHGLGAVAGAPPSAVTMATIGPLLLSVGVAAGVVRGDDPSWFVVVGGPALLLWLAGTVRIGMAAWRSGRLPRPVAVLVALTVPVAVVPFGEVGGSAVAGGVWLWLAATALRPDAVTPVAVR